MNYIEVDPSKVHVMNNYALVEFIDDDIEKNKLIQIVKQNNSTKLRSIYVGRIIDRPEFIYNDASQTTKVSLDDLVKGESIIAYNPMSIQYGVKHEDKEYHIIRAEDIYCKLVDYKKEG